MKTVLHKTIWTVGICCHADVWTSVLIETCDFSKFLVPSSKYLSFPFFVVVPVCSRDADYKHLFFLYSLRHQRTCLLLYFQYGPCRTILYCYTGQAESKINLEMLEFTDDLWWECCTYLKRNFFNTGGWNNLFFICLFVFKKASVCEVKHQANLKWQEEERRRLLSCELCKCAGVGVTEQK